MTAGYRQMIAYVDAGNAPSLSLHEAFGFERMGILKGVGFGIGRWTDSLLMQRALGRGHLSAARRLRRRADPAGFE